MQDRDKQFVAVLTADEQQRVRDFLKAPVYDVKPPQVPYQGSHCKYTKNRNG